ncbi:MAG TPA: ABC transporter permease subunit [Methanocella sp.]|jgi:ABC-2 type transport system permease protein
MTTKNLKSQENLGWSAGLRNMLHKENAKWWNWKSLAAQLIIWTVIINSMVAMAVFIIPHMTIPDNGSGSQEALDALDFSPAGVLKLGLSMFFQIAGLALLVGGVIIAHDSILKERESGTAAWLLSKPVSRKAFVLSKLIANVVGLLVVVIAVQAIVAYALISIAIGSMAPVMPFLGGLGIMSLTGLFYMVLALALGAFTLSRGVTLGLPIVIGLIGGALLAVVQQLEYVTPWNLSGVALSVAQGASLPDFAIFAIVATIIWTVVFAGAAIWKFEQAEL